MGHQTGELPTYEIERRSTCRNDLDISPKLCFRSESRDGVYVNGEETKNSPSNSFSAVDKSCMIIEGCQQYTEFEY